MDGEYYPLTGLESIYIASVDVDTSAAYTAGTPEEFAPGQDAEWMTEQGEEPLYAKNVLQDIFYGTKKESVRLVITGISPEKDAEIRGIYYDESTGRVYSTGDEYPPYYALGIMMNKGKADAAYVWFPKGTFTGGNMVTTTRKDGVTLNGREYTFNALVTDHKFTVNSESKGVSWVSGDTTDDAFSETGWFSAVQTPDTASAPDAIALSSIVPTDGDTDIAIDTTVVLTFNNKIASESIMLLESTGDAVAVTKTWNAAGKVLTLTPDSNLDNDTQYVVAVAGVVDVYGQALAAVGKDFTTIAA